MYYLLYIYTIGCVIAFRSYNNTISLYRLPSKYSPFHYSENKYRQHKMIRSMKKQFKARKAYEEFATEYEIKKSRISQYNFYGYKMSRSPGDGGSINHFRRGGDNRSTIASYYTGVYNPSLNDLSKYNTLYDKSLPGDVYSIHGVNITRDEIEIINSYPDRTFGRFEGTEPLKSESFAYEHSPLPHDDEYRFYSTGKRPKISKLPRARFKLSHRVKKDQAYMGLIVDILFKGMDQSKVNVLREVEIQLKSRTAKEKPPEKKTYWHRTYVWDIPSDVSSLIAPDEPETENNILSLLDNANDD